MRECVTYEEERKLYVSPCVRKRISRQSIRLLIELISAALISRGLSRKPHAILLKRKR